ncbi:MAG: hypothetical protein Q4D39_03075, partial [Coriobacteriaceae bacterium]|nr:hypothetical protein [Coriobacteriaceae bacterium]
DGAGRRVPDVLLAKYLCERLAKIKLKRGLMVLVDEAQKLADGDLVVIGNAVQQAVASGYRVGLVLCGLPQSYYKIRNVKSCTYLHRMRRVNLWCMGVDETIGFLETMFARVPEMGITQKQIYDVGEFSGGHPYLMQLLGDALYRVVEREANPLDGVAVPVSKEMLREAKRMALKSYKENVLNNVLSGTRKSTREYIYETYRARGANGLASTKEVAERLGMTVREANSIRNYALSTQVIQRERRGYVSFALPHCKYIFEPFEYYGKDASHAKRWRY